MRRAVQLVLSATLLALAGPAAAIEFQPIGTLGLGGAGVARPPAGTAPYWNPGALAFEAEEAYAARLGVGAGVTAHEDLIDDLDRLSRLDVGALENLTGAPASDRALAADAVQLIALVRRIERDHGAISARATALFGHRISRVGIGVYGTTEAAILPSIDSTNILPELGGAPVDAADVSALGTATSSTAFFSASQRAAIEAALAGAGVANPTEVVNTFDAELAASNEAGVTTSEATDALVAFAAALGSGGPLDANASSLRNRGIGLLEVPLAYGHPLSLGPFGTLGVGASVKLMRGRVYVSEVGIFGVDAEDALDELRDRYQDSTTWGVDAGVLWRTGPVLSLGLVGKNLNSPSFRAPQGPDVEAKPQVRAGLALGSSGFLTVVVDLDLTANETALEGWKSRILGGGLEVRPFDWLALRGGAYKNLAESSASGVVTGGLGIGVPWFMLDVNAAASVGQTKYDGEKYPEEMRLEASLTVRF